MQSRQRNPGDGFRLGSGRISPDGPVRGHGMYNSSSNYRNYNRGGFNGGHQKPYLPPPPPRKADILMEAGRLAAEYLVAKGLLPPNLLPPKWSNIKFLESKGQDRDSLVAEGRTSALARLGHSVSDVGSGRRRYNDDYNHMGSRNHSRGRRRVGPYNNRGYGSDWGRENGRNGLWMGRGRGYSDTMEGEDDYATGYHKDRRSGFDEVGSSVSRVAADERHSKSEVTGESGSEVETHETGDDSGSKASSSSTRKDPPPEGDVDMNKEVDDVRVLNSEAGDDVKSDVSGDSKNKSSTEEDLGVQPCEVEGDPISKNSKDLLKLCSFKKAPTKPRSSLVQRNPKIDQGPAAEVSNPVEDASLGVLKVAEGVDPMWGSSSDLHQNPTNPSNLQAPDISSILSVQPVEESLDQERESSPSPPGFRSSRPIVDVKEEMNQREGIKRQREPSPENEYSRLHNLRAKQSSPDDLRAKQSSPDVECLPMDEEMVAAVAVDHEKQVSDALFPKVKPELNPKMEEEKQILPTSFKICDLNLMGTPEITEIPDDPVADHLHTSAPTLETGKELSVDFGLSRGNNTNGSDEYSQLSGDDKVVQVIDLEDDFPIEGNDCDPSKPMNETIYSALDDFMTHEENADLTGIRDGYSLAISEFLGTGISGCPSVSSDLNNLQAGMSLHNAEGVSGDDDSMYAALGEIPISFMEVWDPPPHDYGKFL